MHGSLKFCGTFLLLGALLSLTGCGGHPARDDLHALKVADGGSGTICAPSDEDGISVIAMESVTNVSQSAVPVTAIEVREDSGLRLEDWEFQDNNWPEGGVYRGPIDSGPDGRHNVMPGETVLVVMTVRTDLRAQSEPVEPRLVYVQEDQQRVLPLSWAISLSAPGQDCSELTSSAEP